MDIAWHLCKEEKGGESQAELCKSLQGCKEPQLCGSQQLLLFQRHQ